jgi:hypothetical protein
MNELSQRHLVWVAEINVTACNSVGGCGRGFLDRVGNSAEGGREGGVLECVMFSGKRKKGGNDKNK